MGTQRAMGERRAKESISSAALSAMLLGRASEQARDRGRRAVLARLTFCQA